MLAKFIAPVILVASFTQFAFAQTEFTATLAGHAVLPAQTFIDPPACPTSACVRQIGVLD